MTTHPPPRMANGISCGYCAHGTVHIEFHDEAGNVFAAASMGESQAASFLLMFTASCEAIVDGAERVTVRRAVGLH